MANAIALKSALDHITAHPEEWDQEKWAEKTACGTSCCLAGHAAIQAGYELDWTDEERIVWDLKTETEKVVTYWSACRIKPHGDYPDFVGYNVNGEPSGPFIEDVANDALDLTNGEGDLMYSPSNRLWDLWDKAKQFTDGEIGEVPEVVMEAEKKYWRDDL